MARSGRGVKLCRDTFDTTFCHSVMLFRDISCPKKVHEVALRSVGVTASNLAIQIDRASRWVNDRYPKPPKIASKRIFETNDFTNLSTMSSPSTLNAIAPRPRFLALSESNEKKSTHLVWQEYE